MKTNNMRKLDRFETMRKANMLCEKRHIESKTLSVNNKPVMKEGRGWEYGDDEDGYSEDEDRDKVSLIVGKDGEPVSVTVNGENLTIGKYCGVLPYKGGREPHENFPGLRHDEGFRKIELIRSYGGQKWWVGYDKFDGSGREHFTPHEFPSYDEFNGGDGGGDDYGY